MEDVAVPTAAMAAVVVGVVVLVEEAVDAAPSNLACFATSVARKDI